MKLPQTIIYKNIDKVTQRSDSVHADYFPYDIEISVSGVLSPIVIHPTTYKNLIKDKGFEDFILNHGWTNLLVGYDKVTGEILEFLPLWTGLTYEIKILNRGGEEIKESIDNDLS